jgi:hypothetical protein
MCYGAALSACSAKNTDKLRGSDMPGGTARNQTLQAAQAGPTSSFSCRKSSVSSALRWYSFSDISACLQANKAGGSCQTQSRLAATLARTPCNCTSGLRLI